MTDHIGDATEKVDLDALEKRLRGAADDFADHATPIEGDGPTATLLREAADGIVELKEARALLDEIFLDGRLTPDRGINMLAVRDLERRYGEQLKHRGNMLNAFLVRDGMGEG